MKQEPVPVARFLIRRKDYKQFKELTCIGDKIDFIINNHCIPELSGNTISRDVLELIRQRDTRLQEIASEIWMKPMMQYSDESK